MTVDDVPEDAPYALLVVVPAPPYSPLAAPGATASTPQDSCKRPTFGSSTSHPAADATSSAGAMAHTTQRMAGRARIIGSQKLPTAPRWKLSSVSRPVESA